MQKSILLIGLIFTLAKTSGQTARIELGVEGGSGITYLRGSERIEQLQKRAMGFYGGFAFQLNLNEVISIRTILAGEIKGSSSTFVLIDQFGNTSRNQKQRLNLSYVTLPILIRASFGEKNRFFLNGGPYVGYLLRQPSEAALDITFRRTPVKKLDMGITTGFGFSFPIKSKAAFSIEMRHSLGLYNISTPKAGFSETIKTNSANLLLSYTRKLGFKNKSAG